MPELPEVEIVKRGLAELLPKHRITDVSFDTPKSFPNAQSDVKAFLIGARVLDVRRRAKVLIIDLDSDYSLVIHLKMTGQLVYIADVDENDQAPSPNVKLRGNHVALRKSQVIPNELIFKSKMRTTNYELPSTVPIKRFGGGHPTNSLVGTLPDRSTRVVIELDGAKLFFNDQRKFGWIRLLPTVEIPHIDFFQKVGPEPLEDTFTPEAFILRLRHRSRTTIKAALLDQTVIAGVGNIYADESLWAARIHPSSRVGDISRAKLRVLFSELQKVLLLSIAKGGSTDRHYVDAEGRKGSYLSFANVFRRDGKPCPRHPGTLIQKIRVAGRGTHICPRCQKI